MEQHPPAPGGPPAPGDQPAELVDTHSERALVESDVVYSGWIWNVVKDGFRLDPDSDEVLVRDYIDHPGAVAVLALDDDGRVLLINQYRHPVKMNLWEIPAGLLDVAGEPYQAAAAREFAEEADLQAARWDVLVDVFNSPGSSSEAIRIFLARDLTPVPESERHTRTHEEAEIQYRWVALDEATRAVMEGRIHNPSAVAGVLAATAARADGFTSLRPADAAWEAHPGERDAHPGEPLGR